jgi:predicted KAP-like P-loop ATPase
MWSDKESESDYLNFGEVSQLAVDILTSPGMLPVSLGVFGNWGSGKSSLLKLIERDLQKGDNDRLVINFDAWMYQGYDDARAALLEVIATKLNKAAESNEGLAKKTRSLLARVNGFRVLGLLAEGAALISSVPTGGMLAKGIGALTNLSDGVQNQTEYEELGKAAKDAKGATNGLIKPAAKASPPQQIDAFRQEYGEILKEFGKPLVVIIDNLDRCLPANAIHTLEAIRLFLFLPSTAFVIAADEEMVRSAVAEYFRGASVRHQIDYLDKLIQVPIRVPKAGVREIRSYLFMLYAMERGVTGEQLEILRTRLEASLQQSWQEEPIPKDEVIELIGKQDDSDLGRAYDLADRIAPILATSPIIHGNPRIVKRLLNVIKMRSQIAHRRKIPLDESVITKLVIFERCAGADATAALYRLIDAEAGIPAIFEQLEDPKITELPAGVSDSWNENPTTKGFILEWAKLEPALKGRDLRAAIYLSRETMPIGSYVVGLSPIGRKALGVLTGVGNLSSPTGKKVVKGLPLEDHVPVMEGIIENLRQLSDWSKKPKGFAGACLLAQQSAPAANVLNRYVGGLGDLRPWMSTLLKNQNWYKDK